MLHKKQSKTNIMMQAGVKPEKQNRQNRTEAAVVMNCDICSFISVELIILTMLVNSLFSHRSVSNQ